MPKTKKCLTKDCENTGIRPVHSEENNGEIIGYACSECVNDERYLECFFCEGLFPENEIKAHAKTDILECQTHRGESVPDHDDPEDHEGRDPY